MSEKKEEGRKRTRLEYDERRQLILLAARRVFVRTPYSEVSVAQLAEAAGVTRGLLHHYFGSKRDLYLAVVRDVVQVPSIPIPDGSESLPLEAVWERSVEGWIRLIEDNAEPWLAMVQGLGAGWDSEVSALIEDSREVLVEQALTALGMDPQEATPELRALIRAYGGLVQEALLEWLQRGRLNRDQVKALMLDSLPLLLERVLPRL